MTVDAWLEALHDELADLIDAERFEGEADLDRRVLRSLDDHLRRRQRAGQLHGFAGYRVVMAGPGEFEVLLDPGRPRVRQVIVRLTAG